MTTLSFSITTCSLGGSNLYWRVKGRDKEECIERALQIMMWTAKIEDISQVQFVWEVI